MGDKHNKNEEGTDRSGGGPGSAHQGGSHGHAHRDKRGGVAEGVQATNDDRSDRSGGGGERDSHHTHDPHRKGNRSGY